MVRRFWSGILLGMIVNETGVHRNVSEVYVAGARDPMRADSTALAKDVSDAAGEAGIVFDGDEGKSLRRCFLR